MGRFLFLTACLALFCFSPGCSYWYQDSRSFADCEQDLQQCYQEVKKYADMSSVGTYEVDFVKDCMKEKGYTLHFEHDLPRVAKRRDPGINDFWLLAGVSGTIEE
ncbi:MAG: hypothetical protein ACYS9T_06150 [Planctomycetota bacterium]|jgi:hypothetical protein